MLVRLLLLLTMRFSSIIIGLITLTLTAVGAYFVFQKFKKQGVNPMEIVPSKAALILEVHDYMEFTKVLNDDNEIWNSLKTTPTFKSVFITIQTLDSLYGQNLLVKEILDDATLVVSAHKSGGESFDFAFLCNFSQSVSIEDIKTIIGENVNALFKEKKFEDERIFTITKIGKPSFSFTVVNGVFVGSNTILLVEEAIRNAKTGKNLTKEKEFQAVESTAGVNKSANVYVNYSNFPVLFYPILKKVYQENISSLASFAGWTELDANIRPDMVLLNGYTTTDNSTPQYLDMFEGQSPVKAEMFSIIPENAAFILHSGISNAPLFRKRQIDYWSRNGELAEQMTGIMSISKNFNVDIELEFYDWLGKETAILITEPYDQAIIENSFIIFKAADIQEAKKGVNNLSRSTKLPIDSSRYKGYFISDIKIENLFETLLGKAFSLVEKNYYTFIEDYVIFANSPMAIREFISNYEEKNTLSNSEGYQRLMNSISEEANLTLYGHIPRSFKVSPRFLDPYAYLDLEKQKATIDKFHAYVMQISSEKKGLFYNNVVLKYDPIYAPKKNPLAWSCKSESSGFKGKVQTFINHTTGEKEFLVQNNSNELLLIGSKGELLWKRELDEEIMGEIHILDVYKNKKNQMLFNTEKSVFILDRNGKDVEAFPIKFNTSISHPVSVIDYEGKKDYRIFVPMKNGEILLYDSKGKEVEGWTKPKTKAPIVSAIKHFSFSGKDYIIGVDKLGFVYCWDRKGATRKEFSNRNKGKVESGLAYFEGKSFESSSCVTLDSIGSVHTFSFNDTEDAVEQISLDKESKWRFIRSEEQELMVLKNGKEISIYKGMKELLTQITSSESVREFDYLNGVIIIHTSSNQVYLYSKDGTSLNPFEIISSTFPALISEGENSFYLIVTNESEVSAIKVNP